MTRLLSIIAGLFILSGQYVPVPFNPGAGGGGPTYTGQHCMSVATPNPSCSVAVSSGNTIVILGNNFFASGTLADTNGTPTQCNNYPAAWDGGSDAQVYTETGAASGTHTFTYTPGTSNFPILLVLVASTSTSIQCDGSTLFANLAAGTTATGTTFSNSANALVFCFAGPSGGPSAVTPSGSSFTLTQVDTGGSGYSTSAEGSIAGAGSNFCAFADSFSNQHFVATVVIN